MRKMDKKNKKGSTPWRSARDIEEQASENMKRRDAAESDLVGEPEETRVDGSCSVRISEDGMSALVSLHPSLHGGEPLTFEDVMKEVATAGVVHGVNEDLLKKLIMAVEKTKEEKQGVMFAKGTPPEEGLDGRVEYHFGEDDAVLTPPEEGEE
jgi:hypothetical protein